MLVAMTYRTTKTKNSDEIANEIVEFGTTIKTSEINVVVCSIVSKKDQINNKAKEVNENLKYKCEEHNLQLIQHHNINLFHYTNTRGLHLNNYGEKQLTRNFSSFIKNG